MSTKVLLVSNNRFLNTTLYNVISEEMDLQCEICGLQKLFTMHENSHDDRNDRRHLLLLDFNGLDSDTIAKAIWQYHHNEYKEFRTTAFYNISREAGVENWLLELGVRGIFYDDDGLDLFKKGVTSLLQGDVWFPRKVLFEYIREQPLQEIQAMSFHEDNFRLTPREEEILIMISSGKSNAEIAEELYISKSTVKTHTYNIFQKINVPNRIQAALWTVKHLKDEKTPKIHGN